ncbi:MAG: L-2-hydroxyglutarate oxidase [Marivirga sp.]|jgi:L-2-hydroxyglutarate oxidase
MQKSYDIIIVGGGIVGLATAYEIKKKQADRKVLLLEKEGSLALHQTGNNSGVIHSGIYYTPGSLKAKNCIDGYHKLLQFCDEEGIPYDLCGKIIVATNKNELAALKTIEERGLANGLTGLKRLVGDEVKEYEPYVNGVGGIHVPQTGIIDYTAVALKYAEKFQELGGDIILNERVTNITTAQGISLVITGNDQYQCKLVINCAGLYSDKIAKLTSGKLDLKIIPFRGEYYMLKPEKQYLVKNLIYPVPDPSFPFLGVHFTRMINGGIEAGPNAVLAFKREGYRKSLFNLVELGETLAWPGFQKVAAKYWKTGFGEMYRSFSKSAFTKALQKLMPDITESDLIPGGAGVRAQACDRNGGLIDDFLILEEENAINVCNAPSPAATSSLAIGDHISNLALKRF